MARTAEDLVLSSDGKYRTRADDRAFRKQHDPRIPLGQALGTIGSLLALIGLLVWLTW